MVQAYPQLVFSTAGRDKGGCFCVVGQEGPYLLLCDGKRRRVESPKRKKRIHTADAGAFHHPVLEAIRAGNPTSNREIRRALAAFRAEKLRRV